MPHRRFVLALLAAAPLAACQDKGKAAADDGAAFLAKNAKAAGIHVTASGLQYRIMRSGPAAGLKPHLGDEVKVNYEGKLLSGVTFDSSFERGAPAVMQLRKGGLIDGWVEALQLMRPGDEWQVYVPPALGYGKEGKGPIPPNAVMVFRIELIDVLPGAGSVGRV
jgi:peptidylprolyl isomerase/FKBP-type peptidyl-prolyl cis-trans isomerase FklB